MRWLDARWANDHRDVHPMGINLPEEDEYVLFFRLASGAMWETFPDARFVYLVRDPRKVVASTASLLHAALAGVGALHSDEQLMEMVHEISERMYGETLDNLSDLPPERLVVVKQEDLVSDLDGTLSGMLGQLGLPYTETLRAAAERARREGPKRTHRYSLADWGLTEAEVIDRYRGVMERWGYPTGS